VRIRYDESPNDGPRHPIPLPDFLVGCACLVCQTAINVVYVDPDNSVWQDAWDQCDARDSALGRCDTAVACEWQRQRRWRAAAEERRMRARSRSG